MNESDQQDLFKRVQKRFRAWSERKCSGYVHGIADEASDLEPLSCATSNLQEEEHLQDEYYIAYLYGFIDARGPDVLSEDWYKSNFQAVASPTKMDFQWWVKK